MNEINSNVTALLGVQIRNILPWKDWFMAYAMIVKWGSPPLWIYYALIIEQLIHVEMGQRDDSGYFFLKADAFESTSLFLKIQIKRGQISERSAEVPCERQWWTTAGTMVIWCSCTWEWCKELRDQNKVECGKLFFCFLELRRSPILRRRALPKSFARQ